MAAGLCDAFFDDVARATVEVLDHNPRHGGHRGIWFHDPGRPGHLRPPGRPDSVDSYRNN